MTEDRVRAASARVGGRVGRVLTPVIMFVLTPFLWVGINVFVYFASDEQLDRIDRWCDKQQGGK